MTIGLYFGSFNPIHIGHLIIANHMAEYSNLDQIWLVVTPHNPLKKKHNLLDNYQRLEMVYLATQNYEKLQPCDIEFNLPQPNYTINTLTYLEEKYPKHNFSLIMGEDNLRTFHKWKNYDMILKNHAIYVYPRIMEADELPTKTIFYDHKNIHFLDTPIIQISSTHIRKNIKAGKNIKPMLSSNVWQYIDEMNFYKS